MTTTDTAAPAKKRGRPRKDGAQTVHDGQVAASNRARAAANKALREAHPEEWAELYEKCATAEGIMTRRQKQVAALEREEAALAARRAELGL